MEGPTEGSSGGVQDLPETLQQAAVLWKALRGKGLQPSVSRGEAAPKRRNDLSVTGNWVGEIASLRHKKGVLACSDWRAGFFSNLLVLGGASVIV